LKRSRVSVAAWWACLLAFLAGPGAAASVVAGPLSSSDSFMPHGYCFLWNPLVLWLNVISDSLIVLAYYCIPIVLIYIVRKAAPTFLSTGFSGCSAASPGCGTTHLMEVWNIWHASYLVSGIVKGITAVISVATAVRLIPLIPQAVLVPNVIHLEEKNRNLEREVANHKRFHDTCSTLP